jgi:hypothetical protein
MRELLWNSLKGGRKRVLFMIRGNDAQSVLIEQRSEDTGVRMENGARWSCQLRQDVTVSKVRKVAKTMLEKYKY